MIVKKILALFAALVVTFVVISVFQLIGQMIFPSPHEMDWSDIMQSLKLAAASMPVGALILAVVGHALGSLAGGMTLGRILKDDTMNVGMTLGAILTAIGMANMVTLPHPEWFYVDLLAYLPPAIFGANYTSQL